MKNSRCFLVSLLICLFLSASFPPCSLAQERRIIPVAYKSCGPGRDNPYSADHLWDGVEGEEHKWCCFHAGYLVPQTHWIIMDLGMVYPLSKIVVVHAGNEKELMHLLTEDYKIFGSSRSMNGPWFIVREIQNNGKKRNEIEIMNTKVRYLGLEVTDPQYGASPDKKQDDWAVRIFEIYIYASNERKTLTPGFQTPNQSPFALSGPSAPPAPSAPPNAPPNPLALPGSGTPQPIQTLQQTGSLIPQTLTTGKKIYYFHNPNVPNCQKLEQILTIPRIKEALRSYSFEAIHAGSRDPLLTKYGVFVVPTLIIVDSQGSILDKSSSISNEADLMALLK